MFGIRATNKFLILGPDADAVDHWMQLLQETGLPIGKGRIHLGSIFPSKFTCAILLDAALDEEGHLLPEHRNMFDSYEETPFFIISGDQRWKHIQANQSGVYYISSQSHPFEAARFMVEKLNYSFIGNAPAYAFSFFQF